MVSAALLLMLIPANAQVTLSMQAPAVGPGDVALLTVTLDQATGVAGADLVINSPDFVLPDLAETTPATSDFLIASRSEAGRIQIALARAKGLADDKVTFLQIPLRITKAAAPGTYPVAVSSARFYSAKPAVLTATASAAALVVVPPSPDLDGDGLPDTWEQHYFGNTQQTASDDFDHDGATNLQEFLAGTDPTSATSVFRLAAVKGWNDSDQPVPSILWLGRDGKDYQIEWSDGPVSPTMVWHRVYNPNILKQGSLFSWTDDGTRTLQEPSTVRERYYRVVIAPKAP